MQSEIKVHDPETVISYFNSFNLEFNISSIRFLMKINKTFAELANYSEENLVLIVQAGLASHNIDEAFNIVNDMLNYGVCLQVWHAIAINSLRDAGFFQKTSDMTVLQNLSGEEEDLETALKGLWDLTNQLKMQVNV